MGEEEGEGRGRGERERERMMSLLFDQWCMFG